MTRRTSRQKNILLAVLITTTVVAAGVLWGRDAVLWFLGKQADVALWVDANPVVGAIAFIAVAALAKVTPVPGGIAVMLTAGYLFGSVTGALLAAAGAACSALAVAAVGRRLLFDTIHEAWGHRLRPIEEAVAEDGFQYLLSARLLPVVPAWLVNLVPVAFPIPLWAVGTATFFGLLPVSFIVADLGAGFAKVFSAEDLSAADVLLSTDTFLPLAALSALVLGSVWIKHRRKKRAGG